MGEVHLDRSLTPEEVSKVGHALQAVGFEVIENRISKMVEDVKLAILDYLATPSDRQSKNLSAFITDRIPNDYSYISDIFSSSQGKTIEQFFILQRIEKVKELIAYDQLSITQISYLTGYSSVHHLSAQFKKVTGLTPSRFKQVADKTRKGLDQI